MTSVTTALTDLYRVRKGQVAFVEVPELGYLTVEGRGAPDGQEFAVAAQALQTISNDALVTMAGSAGRRGAAQRVMPLEAQWWVDDPDLVEIIGGATTGLPPMSNPGRERWRWRAMIVQPSPIDAVLLARVIRSGSRSGRHRDRLRYERWTEGRCAQVLHVGPLGTELPSIVRLYEGITANGCQPHGRHHEIYLGTDRNDEQRIILRLPVEPVAARPGSEVVRTTARGRRR